MTRSLPPTRPAPGRRCPSRRQAGQALPLLLVVLALVAVVGLALARGGSAAIDEARARTAADAAALAGAADGPDAAALVARANGAVLERFAREGADVVVTVRQGGAEAEARARQEGTWCPADARLGPGTSYTSRPCRSNPG